MTRSPANTILQNILKVFLSYINFELQHSVSMPIA
jgi:hypothetical protein